MTQKREVHSGQGVAAGLARLLEIPPQLAARGGERALTAMMAIKHAIDAGSGGLRMNYLADAQKHIARIDPARHGRLIQHLQANVVALGGRGGDSKIVHVTPGELVVPQRLQTPAVIGALRAAAMHVGVDPDSLEIGNGRNSVNPHTGQMEFNDSAQRPKTDWGDRVRHGEKIAPKTPPPDTRPVPPGGPDVDIQVRPDQGGKPARILPYPDTLIPDYGPPVPPSDVYRPSPDFPIGRAVPLLPEEEGPYAPRKAPFNIQAPRKWWRT